MKQCKVCGTLVHIDSNTCPSCGNHNFFVLDVKICPLCGKVNNITNSFCEQCGKQFVTAQSSGINKPAGRPPISRERMVNPQRPTEPQRPASRPPVRGESDIDGIYKKFLALKPDIRENGDDTEYAYYVEGDPERLPVVILPKFAKTSGKNILVNIIVGGPEKSEEPLVEEIKPNYIYKQKAEEQFQPLKQMPDDGFNKQEEVPAAGDLEKIKPYVKDASKMFTPFSAIDDTLPPHLQEEEEEFQAPGVHFEEHEEDTAPRVPKRRLEPLKRNKISMSSVLVSIIMILISAGMLCAFTMIFYDTTAGQYKTGGLSPVFYAIKDMFKAEITPPFPMNNGYPQFVANFGGGQFAHLWSIVSYVFLSALLLSIINLFITLFTFKHRTWAKVLMLITGFLQILCFAAIILAIKFVFNLDIAQSLGLGLLISATLSVAYFIVIIFGYKTRGAGY